MAEQVTTMLIKVDLECEKCQKKIKKVLCKIPEIQSQTYDQKANTVTITVVSCFPEKIMKKIRCKGGEAVKCIQIKVPEKPPVPTADKKHTPGKPDKTPSPEPVTGHPARIYLKACCSECYQGFGGGPCYHGHGRPTPQCYGRPVYGSWGGGSCSCRSRGYYVCRCEYVCENDPCTIM
ncbi:unnamed protein product [Dovyalis caffra]|uniref:HMA domain-containing protein n=1 Tax=Dovyalis caffra TaxID=77055 RepID=A0AAV1QQQ4_9ROSI|nr:unnamed protein product [Dovyalis caffra]